MLQAIEATNPNKASITLSLMDIVGGLMVTDVDGVDPVDAEIITSKFAGQDGTHYQGSTRGERNIVITLDVDPFTQAGTAQQIRARLMRFFMPKSRIQLKFVRLGAPDLFIAGRVESFDFPLMVKEPQVTLSIICTEPDFVDPTPRKNESMSNPGTADNVITYGGSVDTGFLFKLLVNRPISEFSIFQRPGDGSLFELEFDGVDLQNGDILEISTVDRRKRATLIRNGKSRSVLYAISPYSTWISLSPGYNNIVVRAEGAGVPYTIEYTDKIGGL